MRGTFVNDQPNIDIEVRGSITKTISAIVDSGYNGYLTIPFEIAFPLGLTLIGIESGSLADGSSSAYLVCVGEVCIEGKCIRTTIDVQPGNKILLGTKLLKGLGKVFILDAKKGSVEITDSAAASIAVAEQSSESSQSLAD